MKRVFLIGGLGLFLVAGFIFGGLWRAGKAQKESQSAVERVFQDELWAQNWARVNGRIDVTSYVAKLREIRVADCPQGFRVAWVDYVRAWELALKPGDGSAVANLIGVAVAFKTGFVLPTVEPEKRLDRDTMRAAVIREAAKIGVDPPKEF